MGTYCWCHILAYTRIWCVKIASLALLWGDSGEHPATTATKGQENVFSTKQVCEWDQFRLAHNSRCDGILAENYRGGSFSLIDKLLPDMKGLRHSWWCHEEIRNRLFVGFGWEWTLKCLSLLFQIIFVLQKKTSTWSTSPGLRSVTWRRGRSCLRLLNLQHQVSSEPQRLDDRLWDRSTNFWIYYKGWIKYLTDCNVL